MFAFLNDAKEKAVHYWDEAGRESKQYYSSVSPDMDYSMVGEARSTPTIFSVPSGVGRKWLAAVGGGYNASATPGYGSSVYLLDLGKGGKVARGIQMPDNPGGLVNSVPAPPTAVTADGTSIATYKGALAYVADRESKLYKIDARDDALGYQYTELFNGNGNEVNQRVSERPITPSTDSNNKLWVYFGTGNQEKVQLSLSTIQNRIFGIKDEHFPLFQSVSKTTANDLKNVTGAGATCPSESDAGWYLNLGRDEKVVGKIALDKQVLYAPVYKPDTAQLCFPGISTLYQMGYGCGKVLKQTELGTGLVAGVRIHKDKVYVSISGTPDNQTEINLDDGFIKKGNIAYGSASDAANSAGGRVKIESWREKF